MRKNITNEQNQKYRHYLHQKGFYRNSSKSDYYSSIYEHKNGDRIIMVIIGVSKFGSSVDIKCINAITGERESSISSYNTCLTRFVEFKSVIESLIKKEN